MTEATGECNQQVVCILGMHRSGTSLLTRILNLIGLDVGPEDLLLQPRFGNLKGYWEHEGIISLNDAILERHGGSWHQPPIFPPGWENDPSIEDLKQRGRTLIQEAFAKSHTWGWKDPRNCLTLPFWQELLPEMRYVVCLRNPVDVAYSLEDLHGIPADVCSTLWLTYVTSALQHSDGRPRLTVFYEDLVDNLERELPRLAAFLGMPERAEQMEVKAKVREFTEKGLQHFRTSVVDTNVNPSIDRHARALFIAQRISMRLGRIGTDPQDEMNEQIERALDLLGQHSVEPQNQPNHLHEQPPLGGELLPGTQHTIDILQKRLAARSEAVEAIAVVLEQREQERKKLAGQLAEKVGALQESELRAKESEEKIQLVSAQLVNTENQLRQVTDTLGWRLLSRFGPLKYKYVLPFFRLFGRSRAQKNEARPSHDGN